MKRECYFVYIVASKSRVLYIGMTNSVDRRVWEHKNDVTDGFSKHYRCHRLVYFESFDDVRRAIDREKQLKRWNRAKKIWLIERLNPTWEGLAADQRHRYTPEKQVPPLAS
jgi:putative endonuclease